MLTLAAAPAQAASSDWAAADYIKARLIAAGERAALEVTIEPGWHIYWRMPGDGGLPPTLDWSGSENLKEVAVSWPAPKRFEYEGLFGFGYEDKVILPLAPVASETGKPITLALKGEIMACKDICVPQTVNLSLAMDGQSTDHEKIIEEAVSSLPHDGDLPGLKIENAVLGPDALVVRAFVEGTFEKADLFAEAGNDLYITARPEITVDEKDPRYANFRIKAPEGIDDFAKAIMDRKLVLTLVADGKAIERRFDF